ncbi:hypothetical protein FRC12_024231 [Ceratobasidium sp. 428]|nr:hypothetical protein FRC12_024231 [Ceratobasidium sp. 428]
MSTSLDTLRNALRPSPCKWDECPAILSSWALLEKHCRKVHSTPAATAGNRGQKMYECRVRQTKTKICGLTFDKPEEVCNHMVSVHYTQSLYICPVQGCRANLRRYVTDNRIHDHFDMHLTDGEALPQAIQRQIPRTPKSLLPPIPKGQYHPSQILQGTFLPNGTINFKPPNPPDFASVGSIIYNAWLAEEESQSPAKVIKPRQRRGLGGAATHPAKRTLPLPIPPQFQHVSKLSPATSVGFESLRFHQIAQEAFDLVAADTSSGEDSEPELMLTKPRQLKQTRRAPEMEVDLDSDL